MILFSTHCNPMSTILIPVLFPLLGWSKSFKQITICTRAYFNYLVHCRCWIGLVWIPQIVVILSLPLSLMPTQIYTFSLLNQPGLAINLLFNFIKHENYVQVTECCCTSEVYRKLGWNRNFRCWIKFLLCPQRIEQRRDAWEDKYMRPLLAV